MQITYRVEPSTISPYIYKRPLVTVDEENGEVGFTTRISGKGVVVKRVTLLNLVGYDEEDKLVSFEPMHYVNEYLLSHHIDKSKLESDQLSRALGHYFTFIISNQALWDLDYDEDTFDELYDAPRPRWDYFPKRKSEKLTYLYREALKDLVLNQLDDSERMARTTAKAYILAVVGFYKYHLRKGYKFNNPPFELEIVTLNFQAGASKMKAYTKKDVHTTDLRLSFSKSSRNEGGVLANYRRDLKPLTDKEWALVQNILIKSKRIIKNVKGEMRMQSLAVEYCLGFMVCRYAGLRREEMASLHRGQIVKPIVVIRDGKEVFEKPLLSLGVGGQFGSLTKTKEAGNKSRKTIIPSMLMNALYEYTKSERYQKRLAKFKDYCREQMVAGNTAIFEGDDAIDKDKDYIFISQNGIPLISRPSDFTSRWVEVRNTVNHTSKLNHEMLGSLHNLRSTFAVNLFRVLLKKMKADEALAIVSSYLGHEEQSTTLEYLKIAENAPSGDEIYEDVLDYLGLFDDLDGVILT
ncbi:site-specific integrase [Aeromonas veronii]|uniref:site-specific integrase n=1 Tax=Aeromonas veronii TaxID=654 RepID=UPI000E1F77B0|nr:site-specific integrase [Aeromonas veronii]RDU85925.1 integrase [Aeromonas veronii]RDU94236.1 integrase [Aeromonas veronii]TEY69178.1 integrase [Aeromonas veronii]